MKIKVTGDSGKHKVNLFLGTCFFSLDPWVARQLANALGTIASRLEQVQPLAILVQGDADAE